ncbi:MAG: 16S rRNA (uracil(1498)-N(3))-methyltransferase [Chloroflexi bacterium]|nr:16S rRNA (uracil(1498)-N(3))-methyltransferase [Chloroflexota bacterium]
MTLPGDVSHQLRRVLRARAGDEIVVLDDTGMEYVVRLENVDMYGVSGAVIRRYASRTEPSVAITLYQCILKADRFE